MFSSNRITLLKQTQHPSIYTSLFIFLALVSFHQDLRAQDITVTLRSISGSSRGASELDPVIIPVNAEECGNNIELNVRLENIPQDQRLIDIWRSTGTACNEEGPRQDANQTGCTNVNIRGVEISGSTRDISLEVQTLLGCDAEDEEFSTYEIYFLATGSNGSTDSVGTSWGIFEVAVDTIAPSRPTDLSVVNGESQIKINWNSTGEELRKYNLYVEQGPCSETELLAAASAGNPVPTGTTKYSSPAETSSSASIDGNNTSDLGFSLALDEQIALGLTAVDQAGNESLVSVVCGRRIETRGFCDEYGGCPNNCSVHFPGNQNYANMPTLLTFLLMLALAVFHSNRKRQFLMKQNRRNPDLSKGQSS